MCNCIKSDADGCSQDEWWSKWWCWRFHSASVLCRCQSPEFTLARGKMCSSYQLILNFSPSRQGFVQIPLFCTVDDRIIPIQMFLTCPVSSVCSFCWNKFHSNVFSEEGLGLNVLIIHHLSQFFLLFNTSCVCTGEKEVDYFLIRACGLQKCANDFNWLKKNKSYL